MRLKSATIASESLELLKYFPKLHTIPCQGVAQRCDKRSMETSIIKYARYRLASLRRPNRLKQLNRSASSRH